MRILRTVGCAILLCCFCSIARADFVFVTPADYIGERSTPAAFGINPNGSWATIGIKVSWNISETAGVFTYKWKIEGINGDLSDAAVSHSLFETSLDFSRDDILPGSSTIPDDEIKTHKPTQGNPGMPGDLHGIKFDFGGTAPEYTLVTTRRPVWGDFYSKDGGDNYAFNTGFGTDPPVAGPFTNWIPTPDTATIVPLPAAAWMGMALIGSIGGAGFLRRRRQLA